jgi:hypothetical protein
VHFVRTESDVVKARDSRDAEGPAGTQFVPPTSMEDINHEALV